MTTISLILHVTAAVILVGPQVLMFLAVVPASWLIEDDEKLKRALLRVVAGRFGRLAAISLALLVITGLYQYFAIVPPNVREAPNDYNFGVIFTLKMMMFVLLVILSGVHTYRFSKRITDLSDRVIALEGDPSSARREEGRVLAGELERARLRSFAFSAGILGVSLITLWLGVALGHESFAWAQR